MRSLIALAVASAALAVSSNAALAQPAPAKPAQPAPAKPAQPAPAKPAQPAPAKPAKPGVPAKPGAPEKADAPPAGAADAPPADAPPSDAPPEPVDPALAAQRAEALRLFDEGRAKMQIAGKLDEACDVLTKSYDLHHRGDTLLNLAECHRRQGKTATAWREFDEAIRYAQEVEFTEAIAAAAQLRDELAKDLSRLVVEVPADMAKAKGLVVILDGKNLPKEQWGQQLFVDPGTHGVTASADGYKPFEQSTDVKKQSDRAEIVVALVKIPPPPPPPKPAPPPVKPVKKPVPGHVEAWSLVVGGAGIAMLGVSIGTGIDTVLAHKELDDQCGPTRQDCPTTYDFKGAHAREVRSFGMFVGFGLGGIAATTIGGVGLGLGLKSHMPKDVAFAPWFGPTGAGLGLSGTLR